MALTRMYAIKETITCNTVRIAVLKISIQRTQDIYQVFRTIFILKTMFNAINWGEGGGNYTPAAPLFFPISIT
jgi:hypothetical protein